MKDWLPRYIARAPGRVYTKLMAAFMIIVFLLIMVGAVGLKALNEVNHSVEDLVELHQKTAAFRQLQHNTTSQLYGVTTAMLSPDNRVLDSALRQLHQFRYDLERVQVVTADEAELFKKIQNGHEQLVSVITRVVELTRDGKLDEAMEIRLNRVVPLADSLERLTNEIVNRAEAGMIEKIDESQKAYLTSQKIVIGFALGSIGLAMLLGYAISSSLMGPVQKIGVRLSEIASGDFSKHVDVLNRDELGTLADNLNHMNDDLRDLYQQLEAANRHKSEFLANVSHELRTPLNAVIGFSQMLERKVFGELNEKQLDYVQDIQSSGRHLLSLINDILDLSKVDAGKMELEVTSFDIPLAIQNAMTLVKEKAATHGIALELTADGEFNPFAGDERKFKQILLNLLSNAVKFTPDGGSIKVEARQNSEKVEVSVADTGVGIAPEDQETMFEAFLQVGGNSEQKSEGTGLGLALAKKFVELHEGDIRVESEVGKGTVITFTLKEQAI